METLKGEKEKGKSPFCMYGGMGEKEENVLRVLIQWIVLVELRS